MRRCGLALPELTRSALPSHLHIGDGATAVGELGAKGALATWLKLTGADLLGLALTGQGSSRAAMVEVLRRYSNLGAGKAEQATPLIGEVRAESQDQLVGLR